MPGLIENASAGAYIRNAEIVVVKSQVKVVKKELPFVGYNDFRKGAD